MGIRTVRLDEETEKVLEEIVSVTGLSVSAAMKKGLVVFRDAAVRAARRAPYDIYKELDLGPGGQPLRPPPGPAGRFARPSAASSGGDSPRHRAGRRAV
jgi:hypothetical protein